MAIEVTDVEQLEKPSAPVPAQELPMEDQTAPLVAAPRGRGRPPGSKDKQPRKRPARAAAWADVAGEDEEEEEETQEPPPRPPTRRRSSAPKKKSSAPRRRVQIVTEESASSASSAEEEEDEEEAPPPSPRTTRHQQWAAYRQQKTDAHQANVNRYAALFDRMLA